MWISVGALGERLRHGQRRRLRRAASSATVAFCAAAPAPIVTSRNSSLERVQHDARRRLGDLDADRFGAVEPRVREVDDERQVVVVGRDGRRQPLGGRAASAARSRATASAADAGVACRPVYRET